MGKRRTATLAADWRISVSEHLPRPATVLKGWRQHGQGGAIHVERQKAAARMLTVRASTLCLRMDQAALAGAVTGCVSGGR
jgi:hypothetical protein